MMPLRTEQGIALIIVLWVLVLITVTTGSFTVLARTENLQAHQLLTGTQARYAAEAGLNLAVLRLKDPVAETRWIPDGRIYRWQFEGHLLEISIIDERGKINLNSVNEATLINWLVTTGLEDQQVAQLVDVILDWQDADDITRANGAELADYEAEGIPYGPTNTSFIILEELQQVLGINNVLYRQLEPALTLYGRGGAVDPAFAPYEALLSVPGMTPELARTYVEDRSSMQAGDGQLLQLPPA